MDGVGARIGRSLESYCTEALFVAGGFWLVDTALFALDGVVAISSPDPMVVKLAAVLASAIGLLGLYPRLADQSPRIARVGSVLLVFSGIASTVLLISTLSAGAMASITPPPTVAASVPFVPLLLGMLLYGKVSLDGDRRSRAVGILLLAHLGALNAAIPAAGPIEAGLVGAAAVTIIIVAFRVQSGTGQAWTVPDSPLRRGDDV